MRSFFELGVYDATLDASSTFRTCLDDLPLREVKCLAIVVLRTMRMMILFWLFTMACFPKFPHCHIDNPKTSARPLFDRSSLQQA